MDKNIIFFLIFFYVLCLTTESHSKPRRWKRQLQFPGEVDIDTDDVTNEDRFGGGQWRPDNNRPWNNGNRPQGNNWNQGNRPGGNNWNQGNRPNGNNGNQGNRPNGNNGNQGNRPGGNIPNGNTPNGNNRPNQNGNNQQQQQSTTTAAPATPNPQCIRECIRTPEYNPICGNNGQSYDNPSQLACARRCGIPSLAQVRIGRCPPPPAAET